VHVGETGRRDAQERWRELKRNAWRYRLDLFAGDDVTSVSMIAAAMEKYGVHKFKFDIIEAGLTRSQTSMREPYWIEAL
jgi:hypothetical protein